MKILKFKLLKDFARKHPGAADPLMRWAEFVEKTEWKSHAELKQAFPSADYVGNDRYVFNISGNSLFAPFGDDWREGIDYPQVPFPSVIPPAVIHIRPLRGRQAA